MPDYPDLIHVLPFRSVHPDGVGDYAAMLAGAMREHSGIDTRFVVVNPDDGTADVADGFATIPLAERSSQCLASTLLSLTTERPGTALIIHFAGYGYARTGAPFWLARALETVRRQQPAVGIIGVFHELFATGPVHRRSFWTGLLQKAFVRRAARCCDHLVTTNDNYGRWLRTARADAEILTLPVFSTIGEARGDTHTRQRPRQLAIFARGNAAAVIYQQRLDHVRMAIAMTGAERIIDIGQRSVAPPEQIDGTPVTTLGRLPAEQVAEQLNGCRHGLIDYGAMPLAKSTLFAAYAANGVIPVCIVGDGAPQDGLVAGRHYVALSPKASALDWTGQDENTMRAEVMGWYQTHGLNEQAARFAEMAAARPEAVLHR